MPKLKVATCQFAIGGNVRRNATQIKKQITQAKKQRAQVVHFPEAALTGYAGVDVKTWDGFDWEALREDEIACRSLGLRTENCLQRHARTRPKDGCGFACENPLEERQIVTIDGGC